MPFISDFFLPKKNQAKKATAKNPATATINFAVGVGTLTHFPVTGEIQAIAAFNKFLFIRVCFPTILLFARIREGEDRVMIPDLFW